MKVLITGAAGFIGFHLIKALLNDKFLDKDSFVVGIDNLNDYYEVELKQERVRILSELPTAKAFKFIELDFADREAMSALFSKYKFDVVINLGAQAGVRYSIENPNAYMDSNMVGFLNVLEGCRHTKVKHLIYASSSSVYGMNIKQPFTTADCVDFPISLYAATKKSNELMAHSYSHLYGIPTTGLRFFTVYGPYGRPDMAYFSFTKKILAGEPIDVFNNGIMQRDFTYIDDIIQGIMRIMEKPPSPQTSSITTATAPYKLYNIGNNQPITLRRFITAIESACGKKAKENLLPMQAGDVPITYADIDELVEDIGFRPKTNIEEGIEKFVNWYRAYYSV
ncbi:NAD-dependent epimerase [Psychrobacter immobilis]|uniref:NAD-dependent epimerase n=1 Tax=Psychrobacter immobilis TaxID=498 RepID=UPI00191A8DBC|nr:NAD-dependent epimerase [Psychrobacter immobilis]